MQHCGRDQHWPVVAFGEMLMQGDGHSLMRGGPVFRLFQALGLLRRRRFLAPWVALACLLVAMGPLVVLCLSQGTLAGDRVAVPLLHDPAVLARFLLALPLLVLWAPRIDMMVKRDLRQLRLLPLVRRGREARLEAIFHSMRRLRDARTPEVVCLVAALVPSLFGMASLEALPGIGSWRVAEGGGPSLAVQWLNVVSMPLFRFVGALWLWRFFLWVHLLWRLSRIGLVLRPAHPDGAGGIAFLGVVQARFAILAFAGGLLICGEAANQVLYLGETVHGLRFLLLGYVVGVTVLLVAPLALLAPTMLRARRKALRRYDLLGHRMARRFDRRWTRWPAPSGGDSLLDDDDASGMADYAGGPYQAVKRMSSMPLSRVNLLAIVLMAGVPLVPLVFLAIPLVDLLGRIFSTLF
ncbi:hypothetical protein H4F98_03470 [Lysobacter spongiae]|uniref:Uncharacterized protein n=1 Tax=Marilutibacter spongiae TaxID=2025720 RepID=A0A7W3TKJ2_9GAMM|nr:hypothetical protein [Lysobacter spongiae]